MRTGRPREQNEYYEVYTGVTAIRLSKGKFALIDTKNIAKVIHYKWSTCSDKTTFYAVTNVPRPGGGYTKTGMHRILMNAPHGVEVDHEDGNGLRNLEDNMRLATHRENMQNWHPQTSSEFSGVCVRKSGKAEAYIRVLGKQIYLGRFDTETEAAAVYRMACKDLESGLVMGRKTHGKARNTERSRPPGMRKV